MTEQHPLVLGDLWEEAWRSYVPNTCLYSSLRGRIASQGKNVCALMVIYPWYPEQVLFVTQMEILSLKEKNNKEDLTIHSPKFRIDFSRRLSGALQPWWPSLNLPAPSQVPSGLFSRHEFRKRSSIRWHTWVSWAILLSSSYCLNGWITWMSGSVAQSLFLRKGPHESHSARFWGLKKEILLTL